MVFEQLESGPFKLKGNMPLIEISLSACFIVENTALKSSVFGFCNPNKSLLNQKDAVMVLEATLMHLSAALCQEINLCPHIDFIFI